MARDTARALIAATDRLCRVVLENAVNVPDIRPLAAAVNELCAAVRAFARPEAELATSGPVPEVRAVLVGDHYTSEGELIRLEDKLRHQLDRLDVTLIPNGRARHEVDGLRISANKLAKHARELFDTVAELYGRDNPNDTERGR